MPTAEIDATSWDCSSPFLRWEATQGDTCKGCTDTVVVRPATLAFRIMALGVCFIEEKKIKSCLKYVHWNTVSFADIVLYGRTNLGNSNCSNIDKGPLLNSKLCMSHMEIMKCCTTWCGYTYRQHKRIVNCQYFSDLLHGKHEKWNNHATGLLVDRYMCVLPNSNTFWSNPICRPSLVQNQLT